MATPLPDKPTDPTPASTPDLPFEQAIERIESIVAQLESGNLSLDDSLARYKQGVTLINRCRAQLADAQTRFDELTDQLTPPDSPPNSPSKSQPNDSDP